MKTRFIHMQYKGADQLPGNHAADQCLCFCYIDSTIPLLPKSKSSNFLPSSVYAQPCLCLTRSETQKTGFVMIQLN